MVILELNQSECTALLSSARLGRLACSKDGQPYVVPFHFVREGMNLYSFCLQGQKIEWMRANPLVCVQVDEFGEQGSGGTSSRMAAMKNCQIGLVGSSNASMHGHC